MTKPTPQLRRHPTTSRKDRPGLCLKVHVFPTLWHPDGIPSFRVILGAPFRDVAKLPYRAALPLSKQEDQSAACIRIAAAEATNLGKLHKPCKLCSRSCITAPPCNHRTKLPGSSEVAPPYRNVEIHVHPYPAVSSLNHSMLKQVPTLYNSATEVAAYNLLGRLCP